MCMYVCTPRVCVCMYVRLLCVYVYVCVMACWCVDVCECVMACWCMDVCDTYRMVNLCRRTYKELHTCVCACACECTCVRECVSVCVCVCVCVLV